MWFNDHSLQEIMAFLTKNFGQKNRSYDLFAPYLTWPKCHSKQVMLDPTFFTNVFLSRGHGTFWLIKITNCTKRNPTKCNQCICNYMQLIVICNYFAPLIILATMLQLHLYLMIFSSYTLEKKFIHNHVHSSCKWTTLGCTAKVSR
jgi:hypothetical protein